SGSVSNRCDVICNPSTFAPGIRTPWPRSTSAERPLPVAAVSTLSKSTLALSQRVVSPQGGARGFCNHTICIQHDGKGKIPLDSRLHSSSWFRLPALLSASAELLADTSVFWP